MITIIFLLVIAIIMSFMAGRFCQAWLIETQCLQLKALVLCPDCQKRFERYMKDITMATKRVKP